MATNQAPTKADLLAAMEKKGIKSLEDLIDAVMPEPDETGGYILWDKGNNPGPYNAEDFFPSTKEAFDEGDWQYLGSAMIATMFGRHPQGP